MNWKVQSMRPLLAYSVMLATVIMQCIHHTVNKVEDEIHVIISVMQRKHLSKSGPFNDKLAEQSRNRRIFFMLCVNRWAETWKAESFPLKVRTKTGRPLLHLFSTLRKTVEEAG